ncbi:MAG: NAD(P)-dependent oxidoreductase [Fimbriimonadaceae bacterium]|nr:NAD(P)-dependent oxidoreductase [Fimbriimonadaceae bacterium]
MQIAITGAAGHLGSHLVEQLVASGLTDLLRIDLLPLPAGPGLARQADLSDPTACLAALDGAEVLVHAASIHPWKPYTDQQYLDLNVRATWQVYSAARAVGVRRVVLCSSIAASGYRLDPAWWPVDESRCATGNDIYAFTKHAQEDVARWFAANHGLRTIALRPPAFMPKDPLSTGAGLLGCFTLVDDIAAAHLAAVQAADPPELFTPCFVTNPLPYTTADLPLPADLWDLADRHFAGVKAWFAARGNYSFWLPAVYDTRRARELLGWTPHWSFERWWAANRD